MCSARHVRQRQFVRPFKKLYSLPPAPQPLLSEVDPPKMLPSSSSISSSFSLLLSGLAYILISSVDRLTKPRVDSRLSLVQRSRSFLETRVLSRACPRLADTLAS